MLFRLLNIILNKNQKSINKANTVSKENIVDKTNESKETNTKIIKKLANDDSASFLKAGLKQIYGLYAVDGDTFVGMLDGKKTTFRLAGLDSPEKNNVGFGEAKLFLNSHVGKRVLFIKSRGTDIYDRHIVDVYRDKMKEVFINELIIKNGLATVENYKNSDGEQTHTFAEMKIKKFQEMKARFR